MTEGSSAADVAVRSVGRTVGQVVAVQAFPVKSLGAAPAAAIRVDAGGVAGDRRYAVVAGEQILTADAAPRLRDVVAAADPDGRPTLTLPGADVAVRGPAADEALTALVGRPVRVAAVPTGSVLDAPVHLVSQQALDAAARGEHAAAGCACSLTEPRANLVIDSTGDREEQWIGRALAAGDAVLRVVRRPGHCLGVYAEVERPGTIRPGDPVEVIEER